MTRTQSRLAELDAVSRERWLTDDEQREVKRLAHLERQCHRRRQRYWSEPDYRDMMRRRERDWRLSKGGHMRRAERAKTLPRDDVGRFA